jgi:hypothetical protein
VKAAARPLVILIVAVAICLGTVNAAWAAGNWVVHLVAGSKGEAHAQALPVAPTGVSDSCAAPVTSKTIKVTWSAVTHATAYTVYDSTTSAGGTYAQIASGVTTLSWTSGSLTSGTHYWFEVVAVIGSNWTSPKSAATAQSTINALTPFCTQP